MNLIKINLLPYRQQLEMKQKKQFQTIMALGFVAGVLACGGVYMGLQEMIDRQESRNTTLQAGIEELNKEVVRIKDLEADKKRFLERKRKVEELDNKRFDGARIMDSLNRVVPEGSFLTALKGKGLSEGTINNQKGPIEREYLIEGRALSDNKVALLMAALPSTGMFDLPELVEIKSEFGIQKFVLKSNLVDQVALASTLAAVQAASQAQQPAAQTTTPASAPAAAPAPAAPETPAGSTVAETPPPPPPASGGN